MTDEAWREVLNSRLAELPEDYSAARKTVLELSQEFHAEVARAWKKVVSRELDSRQFNSDAAVQDFQRECNADLRDLHLCFRCPKTGRPASLSTVRRTEEEPYRFRLVTREGRSGRRVTSAFDCDIDFSLMEDTASVERGQSRDGR